MEFQVIWFILWGVLWAVYFTLDGFDLGTGILHNFLAKDENEKKVIMRTIGPVWDGNEVWLLTAGGATFAAFPAVYASMFSYLYTALLLILFSLIFRGVAVEFREKVEGAQWKKGWDKVIFLGSLLVSLLFGVAFGNLFQGLPIDANGYHGDLLSLLNPYGLLTGVLFVLLFVVHGSLWLAIKTEGDLSRRASDVAGKLWYGLLAVAVLFLIYTAFATRLYANYAEHPVLSIVPVIAVFALAGAKYFTMNNQYLKAFYSSGITVLTITFTGVIGLYPNMILSSIDPNYSLTIFNSSSSAYTLKIMTAVALIFVPVIIGYQIWIYRIFRQKLTAAEMEQETY